MSVRPFYPPSCSYLQKMHWGYLAFEVQSVHAFQGTDCPYVSYSVCVSHPGMITLQTALTYGQLQAVDNIYCVLCQRGPWGEILDPETALTSLVLSSVLQMPQNHCSSNCGTHTTTGTPTIVYRYAALIKFRNVKKDKYFNRQTIHKDAYIVFANMQDC